jgi:hypothetical protein
MVNNCQFSAIATARRISPGRTLALCCWKLRSQAAGCDFLGDWLGASTTRFSGVTGGAPARLSQDASGSILLVFSAFRFSPFLIFHDIRMSQSGNPRRSRELARIIKMRNNACSGVRETGRWDC